MSRPFPCLNNHIFPSVSTTMRLVFSLSYYVFPFPISASMYLLSLCLSMYVSSFPPCNHASPFPSDFTPDVTCTFLHHIHSLGIIFSFSFPLDSCTCLTFPREPCLSSTFLSYVLSHLSLCIIPLFYLSLYIMPLSIIHPCLSACLPSFSVLCLYCTILFV